MHRLIASITVGFALTRMGISSNAAPILKTEGGLLISATTVDVGGRFIW